MPRAAEVAIGDDTVQLTVRDNLKTSDTESLIIHVSLGPFL